MLDLSPCGAREGSLIGDRYLLLRKIGEGGMSAIFEARDERTDQLIALKTMIFDDRKRVSEVVKRFLAEARTVSALDSDHIVKVYDVGRDVDSGMPYMAMELLVGEDAETLLSREGALEPLAAVKIAAQAAMGLSVAHEHEVIHRDIKPANIYLVPQRLSPPVGPASPPVGPADGEVRVKILDFGIAKVRRDLAGTDNVGLTKSGNVVGTPLYMSPEQAVGLKTIDARSDVWALGTVLYALLTGRAPFRGADTLGKLIISICSSAVPSIQEQAPWVGPELATIVHRALRRAPHDRYASAGEMMNALLACCSGDVHLAGSMLVGVSEATRGVAEPRIEIDESSLSFLSPGDIEELLSPSASSSASRDPRLSTLSTGPRLARSAQRSDARSAPDGVSDEDDMTETVKRSGDVVRVSGVGDTTEMPSAAQPRDPPSSQGGPEPSTVRMYASPVGRSWLVALALGLGVLFWWWQPWSTDAPRSPESLGASEAPSFAPPVGSTSTAVETASAPASVAAPSASAPPPTTSRAPPSPSTTNTGPKAPQPPPTAVDCDKNPFIMVDGIKALRPECGG